MRQSGGRKSKQLLWHVPKGHDVFLWVDVLILPQIQVRCGFSPNNLRELISVFSWPLSQTLGTSPIVFIYPNINALVLRQRQPWTVTEQVQWICECAAMQCRRSFVSQSQPNCGTTMPPLILIYLAGLLPFRLNRDFATWRVCVVRLKNNSIQCSATKAEQFVSRGLRKKILFGAYLYQAAYVHTKCSLRVCQNNRSNSPL